MERPRYRDPFIPEFKNEVTPYHPTQEQLDYLRDILIVSCSDSRFAEKAYVGVCLMLGVTNHVAPNMAVKTYP